MTREEAWQLVGGYASGNLTPEQESALLTVALEDQDLFNALMAEQPLKELLDDPLARSELLRVLNEEPIAAPTAAALRLPWWRKPMAWAMAGSLAAGLATMGVLWRPAPVPIPVSSNRTAVAQNYDKKPPEKPLEDAVPALRARSIYDQKAPAKPVAPPAVRKNRALREEPQQRPETPAPIPAIPTQELAQPKPAAPAASNGVAPLRDEVQVTAATPAIAPSASAPRTNAFTAPVQKEADAAAPAFELRRAPAMTAMRAPLAKTESAVRPPLGVRLSLQRLQASGAYGNLNLSTASSLSARDTVRLQAVSNTAAYLWLLQRDGTQWRFLLQSDDVPIAPQRPYLAPVPLSPAAADQRLVVVMSATPLTRAQVIDAANTGARESSYSSRPEGDTTYLTPTQAAASTPLVYELKFSLHN